MRQVNSSRSVLFSTFICLFKTLSKKDAVVKILKNFCWFFLFWPIQFNLTYHDHLSWCEDSSDNERFISNFSADHLLISYKLSGELKSKKTDLRPVSKTVPELPAYHFEKLTAQWKEHKTTIIYMNLELRWFIVLQTWIVWHFRKDKIKLILYLIRPLSLTSQHFNEPLLDKHS